MSKIIKTFELSEICSKYLSKCGDMCIGKGKVVLVHLNSESET
jgi:hypothetical protein